MNEERGIPIGRLDSLVNGFVFLFYYNSLYSNINYSCYWIQPVVAVSTE